MQPNQKLAETVSWQLDKHEQLNSEILLCKYVAKKVAKLEKAQDSQYSQRNNIELTGIPN